MSFAGHFDFYSCKIDLCSELCDELSFGFPVVMGLTFQTLCKIVVNIAEDVYLRALRDLIRFMVSLCVVSVCVELNIRTPMSQYSTTFWRRVELAYYYIT